MGPLKAFQSQYDNVNYANNDELDDNRSRTASYTANDSTHLSPGVYVLSKCEILTQNTCSLGCRESVWYSTSDSVI
jgi:hypothetical protein